MFLSSIFCADNYQKKTQHKQDFVVGSTKYLCEAHVRRVTKDFITIFNENKDVLIIFPSAD